MGRRSGLGIAVGAGLQVPRRQRRRFQWSIAVDRRHDTAVGGIYGVSDERFHGDHLFSGATV